MRRAWGLGIGLLVWPALASAQTVLGYQLGVNQSVGGNYGDNAVQVAVDPNAGPQAAPVQQLQGIQFNTSVSANLTVDIVGDALNHAFLLGVAATQLVPTALPEDAQGALTQQLTTFSANATYQMRYTRPRYSVGLGAGYTFNLNGRLEAGADGAQQGTVGGGAATLPGATVGAFAFSGRTHAVNLVGSYTLTRATWDLGFGVTYSYTQNGIFTLAAGGLGGQAQGAAAVGTNLGTFVAANVHSVSPQINYRMNVGTRGTFSASLGSGYSLPEESQDTVTVTSTVTQIVPGPPALPQTLVNNAQLQYTQNFGENRQVGGSLTGTLSYRIPSDPLGQPLPGSGLGPDTLIAVLRAVYGDLLPGELRIEAGLGLAQARMLQPPIGAAVSADDFDGITSDILPIADVRLSRLFDPIDLSLSAARGVGIGALGASAIVSDSASLTAGYALDLAGRRFTANAGFNIQRTVGVGAEDFQFTNPGGAIAAAFNNQGYGGTAGIAAPIFEGAGFIVDSSMSYNYSFVDPDPEGTRGVPTTSLHTFLINLRGTYGRGAANAAAGAGGANDTDELDAFTANPRDGSILTSVRLMQQGATMIELPGQRPGDEPDQRRDSRQAFQQSLRQQQIEQDARDRSEAVQGTGTSQQEEERALEKEKEAQEKREEARSRSFGDVPFEAVPLPTEPPPPAPPPPPPPPAAPPPPR